MFAFKFHPDQDKGECAYGHTVNADAAKTEQDGELPGLSLKQAAKTRSFALLVILAVLLQSVAALVQHVSGSMEVARGLTLEQGLWSFPESCRCGRRQGDYRHPARPCENRGGHRLVCVTWTVRLGSHGDYQCASGSHGCRLPCGYRPGVVLVSLPWMIRQFFGLKDYPMILSVISNGGGITSASPTPSTGRCSILLVRMCRRSSQCRLLHGSCCLRNSCVQTAPDEGGQEQFRTTTQTQGAKQ